MPLTINFCIHVDIIELKTYQEQLCPLTLIKFINLS